MARCISCNTDVGCGCNLISGKCSQCYKLSKNENCTMTLDFLNNLLKKLNEDKSPNVNNKKAIVRSQIAVFNKYPCKYAEIIKNY